jgi:hypothetical protein
MAKAPNDSLWNWLGRQIGHVKKAVKTNVVPPAALPQQSSPPPQQQQSVPPPPPPPPVPESPKVIYREQKAEEIEMPDRPGVKLRRTVIDEVIVDETKPNEQK